MNKIQDIREKIMEARTGEKGVPNEKERFTLVDVLLAMEKIDASYAIGSDGRFQFNGEWIGSPLAVTWNLKDDNLENQSKDCIDFLYMLLCE